MTTSQRINEMSQIELLSDLIDSAAAQEIADSVHESRKALSLDDRLAALATRGIRPDTVGLLFNDRMLDLPLAADSRNASLDSQERAAIVSFGEQIWIDNQAYQLLIDPEAKTLFLKFDTPDPPQSVRLNRASFELHRFADSNLFEIRGLTHGDAYEIIDVHTTPESSAHFE
jgi:hypothetical protein